MLVTDDGDIVMWRTNDVRNMSFMLMRLPLSSAISLIVMNMNARTIDAPAPVADV